jgi:hypothetical protein
MPVKERPLKLSALPKGYNRTPLRSRGPKSIDRRVSHYVGPGEPPPGFINPWNSRPEWVLYWILWKILHEVGNVRRPPFIGGEHFGYQTVVDGGRSSLGGQIVDFVVFMPGADIGMFLTGDRYHLGAGAIQNALDQARLMAAARYMKIIPVYEGEIIQDPTGEAGCRKVVELLVGRRSLNPITSGTFRPSRLNSLYKGAHE